MDKDVGTRREVEEPEAKEAEIKEGGDDSKTSESEESPPRKKEQRHSSGNGPHGLLKASRLG